MMFKGALSNFIKDFIGFRILFNHSEIFIETNEEFTYFLSIYIKFTTTTTCIYAERQLRDDLELIDLICQFILNETVFTYLIEQLPKIACKTELWSIGYVKMRQVVYSHRIINRLPIMEWINPLEIHH